MERKLFIPVLLGTLRQGRESEKVARLLADNSLREELVLAGRERVREFSWERTAAETRAVYAGILGGKR